MCLKCHSEYLALAAYFAQRPPLQDFLAKVRALTVEALGDIVVHVELGGLPDRMMENPVRYRCQLSGDWGLQHLRTAPTVWLSVWSARRGKQPERLPLWRMYYHPSGAHAGFRSPPTLVMGVYLNLLTVAKLKSLGQMANRFMECLVSTECCNYALLDVGNSWNMAYGDLYAWGGQSWVPFDRKIIKLAWYQSGHIMNDKVLGVFWANLLSPSMVQKLGGADLLIDEYHALDSPMDKNLGTLYPDGSVLLRLTRSPADMTGRVDYTRAALTPEEEALAADANVPGIH